MLTEETIRKKFKLYYKRKCFGFISDTGTAGFYPERNIFSLFRDVQKVLPEYFIGKSFVDIGCGIGNILYAINKFGFQGTITGIEINDELVDIAKKMLFRSLLSKDIKLIHADVRNYSFTKFDRIYTFNPFQRKPGKYYLRIWESLSPGTIWLETNARYLPKRFLNRKDSITINRYDKTYSAVCLFK